MPPIPDYGSVPPSVGSIHTATDGRDVLFNDPDGWEIDQPWLWFTDDSPRNPNAGNTFGNPIPGATDAVDGAQGHSLAVVDRCLQLTADKIAGMPWKFYRGRDRLDAPSWITDPQALARDGRRPFIGTMDVRFSGVEFWAQYLRSLLLEGEGIAYTPRIRDDADQPTGPIIAPCYVLNPRHVEIVNGSYAVRDPDAETGWEFLDPRELLITRWIVRPGRRRGIGVIQAHAYDLLNASNLRSYADNLLQRGVPNGYLKSSKPDLDQTKADELKTQWMKAHGGTSKGIAVLNATTEFVPITINPQAMQYVEMAKLSDWNLCHLFGVPPTKLGLSLGSSLQYSTLESANAEYVQDGLMNIARRVESAVDATQPVGTSMKVDFNQLLRADTAARYAAYQIGIDAGFLTRDEVRAFEDLPPLTAEIPAPPTPPIATPTDAELAQIVGGS
jgi:HK97 family phage portal protein